MDCAAIRYERNLNMKYIIENGKLTKYQEKHITNKPYVHVVSKSEYMKWYSDLEEKTLLFQRIQIVRHCHMDVFADFLIGTLAVPSRYDLYAEPLTARIYIDNNKLLFITDEKWLIKYLDEISMLKMIDIESPVQAFFEFLNVLTDDEGEFIETYEDKLIEKENSMLGNLNHIPEDLENYLHTRRRELLILNHYYKQLTDMGVIMSGCPNGMVDKNSSKLFEFFTGRMSRLLSDAQSLREYTLQIRDMYQSRIDVRQNKIMQILTIITSTFMPLTLITGWYGMNFSTMPEIKWKYGYAVVILLSATVLIIELTIYKKKKWF